MISEGSSKSKAIKTLL